MFSVNDIFKLHCLNLAHGRIPMNRSLLVLVLPLFFYQLAFGSEKTLMECKTTLPSVEDGVAPVDMKIEIVSGAGSVKARITEYIVGGSVAFEDTVVISEHFVRDNLISNTAVDGLRLLELENLNFAERLLAHAFFLVEDPEFENIFQVGFDLNSVQAATVYTVGEPTNMGGVAIFVARDSLGRDLGSFLGGFTVSPCR